MIRHYDQPKAVLDAPFLLYRLWSPLDHPCIQAQVSYSISVYIRVEAEQNPLLFALKPIAIRPGLHAMRRNANGETGAAGLRYFIASVLGSKRINLFVGEWHSVVPRVCLSPSRFVLSRNLFLDYRSG